MAYFAHMRNHGPEEKENNTASSDCARGQDSAGLSSFRDMETDPFPPGPRAETSEHAILIDWAKAEAGLAARLARVAGRFGALDERLRRGPKGWRHRLALIEATDLSWQIGERVGADRLALWVSLRLSGVHEDTAALGRLGWAVRRLSGGPGPEVGLSEFLGRRDAEPAFNGAEQLSVSAQGWHALMAAANALHPISRACMGFHVWSLAGLARHGGEVEAAVTAARIAAAEGKGAVFAPLGMGGSVAFRSGGEPSARLARWLEGMDNACHAAMRHLDDIEIWAERAQDVMSPLSGRIPPALRAALVEWPLISAPMAEMLTGGSRAAAQRNLSWMEERGLVREITGQGRFRMWRIG